MGGRGREESTWGIKSTQIRIYCSMFLAFCKIKFACDFSRGCPGSRGREVYRSPRGRESPQDGGNPVAACRKFISAVTALFLLQFVVSSGQRLGFYQGMRPDHRVFKVCIHHEKLCCQAFSVVLSVKSDCELRQEMQEGGEEEGEKKRMSLLRKAISVDAAGLGHLNQAWIDFGKSWNSVKQISGVDLLP